MEQPPDTNLEPEQATTPATEALRAEELTQPLPAPAPSARLRYRWPDMRAVLIVYGIPALVAGLGAVAIVLWLRIGPRVTDIAPRLPEAGPVAGATQNAVPEQPQATPLVGPGQPPDANLMAPMPVAPDVQPPGGLPGGGGPGLGAGPGIPVGGGRPGSGPGGAAAVPNLPGLWPGFRGPDRDNISKDSTPLARTWGPGGPRKLWAVQLGEGYAGPAVANGRVYVLDYDQVARADRLRCLALADGSELWSQAYPVNVKRNHGMSRTVPAVSGKYVVTLGPKCHVMCADANTGAVYWKIDLVQQYGARVPPWYAGQCPLIDGGRAILAPGGRALMIAVDLASGKSAWETPNPRNWQMTHSSVMPVTAEGQKMYVYCASGGVVGVSASNGAILWETPEWTVSTANIPTPVPVGNGRIFLCGGYNAGAAMLRIAKVGGKFVPQFEYKLPSTVFGADQHTPIFYNGHIYGVVPGGQLACLDLSGKRLWTSPSSVRFGLGPYLIAGGMIYALSERGELALVEASPAGYKELARAKVLSGPDAWGPLALAGGRLLARDLTNMVCLDVAAPRGA